MHEALNFKPRLNALLTQLADTSERAEPEGLKAILEYASDIREESPFCWIRNFQQAREQLREAPFWLAYGGARTGSTFSFTLLRILMDSLSDRYLAAWEGDFRQPEVYFALVNQSQSVEAGILKIHRSEPDCPSQLHQGRARAVVTIRDYPAIARSLWRMQHNQASPIYDKNPSEKKLLTILRHEINTEKAKRALPNCLFIREQDVRQKPLQTMREIARFVSIDMDELCLERLQAAVSLEAHANRQKYIRPNQVGHDSESLLHPLHVDDSNHSLNMQAISDLVWRELGHELQQDGYLIEAL